MTRTVTATYRLQFNRDFTFDDARALIPYFRDLGVSHLYASPIFAARPGSTHGYDMVDPTRINPELGGEESFRALVAVAQAAGLGFILDIVPNHMAADRHNPAWMETLCLGPSAPAAGLFDIDWSRGRVVVPVLGGTPEEALGAGEIRLTAEDGWVAARYFEHILPLRPETAADLLARVDGFAEAAAAWRGAAERSDATAIQDARAALRGADADVLATLEARFGTVTAELLDRQHWRLAHWRTGTDELSHRRFFNINELVGVRVEDPAVFDHVHRLPLALIADGSVDGLRVDHVDGLADPEAYCSRLHEAMGPDALLVVEKILEGGEALRPWPIDGTTGYDRLSDINGLFIDGRGHAELDRLMVRHGLLAGSPHERLIAAKRQVLTESFVGEIDRLVRLAPIPHDGSLRPAILALAVHCPVYRSYASPRGHDAADEAVWQASLAAIAAHEPADVAEVAGALIGHLREGRAPEFATRLQQLCGPAMAKGLEDTEFYRSLAIASANEVGGSLESSARSIDDFHARAAAAQSRRDLVPLATHDTKRGADTRARLNLLSLDPAGFLERAARWSALTQPFRRRDGHSMAPDPLDEWLIWQTLVGAWPIDGERLAAYLTKAMREAKRHTRWEAPDEAYEETVLAFAAAITAAPAAQEMRADVDAYVSKLNGPARLASIAQLVLQLTVPGIPDTYQGTEFWDFSLVDPDNRRPVDWAARHEALRAMPPDIVEDEIGVAKLHILRRLLQLRRERPRLFGCSDYLPLAAEESPGRWIAFQRRLDRDALLVAVPTRTIAPLGPLTLPTLSDVGWVGALDGRPLRIEGGTIAVDPRQPWVVAHRTGAGP